MTGAARHGGFTLLEILVALGVFALMAAMAYGGLRTVLGGIDGTDARMERLAEVQTAIRLLTSDLHQAVPRRVRGPYGERLPALHIEQRAPTRLALTRGGVANLTGARRPELQRVAYQLDGQGGLVRISWPVLDAAQDTQPHESVILTEVEALELRFLDRERRWQSTWPPANQPPGTPAGLPLAVEVSVGLNDWGRLRRVIALTAARPPEGGS